ncbi:MAG TPA: sugar phosphate isomerase/epimerase family protein [Bryobacteraceae bacterium]
MKRRSFLQQGCGALAAAPFYNRFADAAEKPIPPAVLKRIGITTVCLRERFPATRTKGMAAPPGGDMKLLAAPKFIADQLGLHNVEVWNFQFDETSMDYCRRLKDAASQVGSKIINIQLDGPYDLSNPDAAKRAESLKFVKEWMDRAAAVGAPTMRANTGGEAPGAVWDVNRIADSFHQLAEYGKKINVKILVENHIGFSKDIDKAVAVTKTVNDPNCRMICDWGNTPAHTDAERVAALSKIFPYLELVSAKELDFDAQNHHTSYDIVPIIKATEKSGFHGIYSIEFYTEKSPPPDPVVAARNMIQVLAANIAPA